MVINYIHGGDRDLFVYDEYTHYTFDLKIKDNSVSLCAESSDSNGNKTIIDYPSTTNISQMLTAVSQNLERCIDIDYFYGEELISRNIFQCINPALGPKDKNASAYDAWRIMIAEAIMIPSKTIHIHTYDYRYKNALYTGASLQAFYR